MGHAISCVILNYNDADTTLSLLDKIEGYRAIDKIVVVDNRSPDDSYDRLLQRRTDHVHVIRSKRNGGYGYGNNVGIRYAIEQFGSDYVIIANPDVEFPESTVEKLFSFLDQHPDYAVATGTQSGQIGGGWKDVGVAADLAFDNILLAKLLRPRNYSKRHFLGRSYSDVFAVPGCFFMVRVAAFVQIGFYDEEFFLYEEEKVIGTKLKQKGWKSAILADCEYVHMHMVSVNKSIKSGGEAKRLVLVSNRLFLKKYKGVSEKTLRLLTPYYSLCVAESAVWTTVKNRLRPQKK